jgi:anti-sigma factor RsiW
MNSDCETMKDQIADLVTGVLSENQEQKLRQHLTECVDCRDYARALKNEDALLTEFVETMDTDMAQRQERLLQTIDRSCESKQMHTPSIWRTIMKSRKTRLAAAAAIIMVGLVVISQFLGGTVTFAQVVEPILNARTVVFVRIKGED